MSLFLPKEVDHDYCWIAAPSRFSPEAFEKLLERQTEAKLRAALEAGEIPKPNQARAYERLAEFVEARDAERRVSEDGWRAREISVAERAAQAAERSTRWAGFAVAISVAALLLAAWPFTPFSK